MVWFINRSFWIPNNTLALHNWFSQSPVESVCATWKRNKLIISNSVAQTNIIGGQFQSEAIIHIYRGIGPCLLTVPNYSQGSLKRIKNKSWILRFDLCLQYIICMHILAKCVILLYFSKWSKKDFNGKRHRLSKIVWSLLSYKHIGMPVIGKGLQQNQCRKVLKPKKPCDLRGLKASNVASPKKEILLKTRHQGKFEISTWASNDLEHLEYCKEVCTLLLQACDNQVVL